MRKQKVKLYRRIYKHLEREKIWAYYDLQVLHSLKDMLAKMMPEDMHGEIDFGPPVGNEILPPWGEA
jgi:hypothetical protein